MLYCARKLTGLQHVVSVPTFLHFCVGTMKSAVHRYCRSVFFLALPHVARRSPCGIASQHMAVLQRCNAVSQTNGSLVPVPEVLCLLQQSWPAYLTPQPVHLAHGYLAADGRWFPPQVHSPIQLACFRPILLCLPSAYHYVRVRVCWLSPVHACTRTRAFSLTTRIYVHATHKRTHHAHERTHARRESRRFGSMVQCRLVQSLNGGSAWRCESYPLPAR